VFIGNVFSYLLQIGLGHLLSIEDFGVFNTFLSLLVIFGIPAGAISVAVIKKVSEYLAKNDLYTLTKLFWSLTKYSFVSGLILTTIFSLLSRQVAGYLNIPRDGVIIAFAGVLAFSFINVAPLAYLQGLLRFKAYALISVVSQFLRLTIPIGLVYAGFKVTGAYGGLIIVAIISFALGILLLHKNLNQGSGLRSADNINLTNIYEQLLLFSIPVFFINSGVAILNNIDVIMVKHFFIPYDAGVYAGVVTMCKVFLFGASMVQVVMFPQISHLHALGANYKSRFLKFLSLQLVLIFSGLAIFTLFPSSINNLMFGGKFADSVPYLPMFALFVALYILITFLSMFLLAINKTKAYLVILPACVIQYLLVSSYHTNLFSIIKANILATGLACLFIAMYVVKSLAYEGLNRHTNLQPGKND
jgi:O-antigen/teichoic acid export membrane protein